MMCKKTIFGILVGLCLMGANPAVAKKPLKAKNVKEQCEAITQKGERCKLKVVGGSKYCTVHHSKNPNSAKCKATTKDGKRCSRAANKGGYCSQHYSMKKGK